MEACWGLGLPELGPPTLFGGWITGSALEPFGEGGDAC